MSPQTFADNVLRDFYIGEPGTLTCGRIRHWNTAAQPTRACATLLVFPAEGA